MLKKWILVTVVLMTTQVFAQTGAQANMQTNAIMGFQEWKNEKVQTALSHLNQVRNHIQKLQAEGQRKTADLFRKQLDQIKWNLEVAQDLSMTDYLFLYLSQHAHPQRFQQAASKMSTIEVAQLLEAYVGTLNPMPTMPAEVAVRPTQAVKIPAKIPVHAIQNRDQVK